jgi:hypothetical protein
MTINLIGPWTGIITWVILYGVAGKKKISRRKIAQGKYDMIGMQGIAGSKYNRFQCTKIQDRNGLINTDL